MAKPEAEEKPGKTFADVLGSLLNEPKRFYHLLAMILCLGLAFALIYLVFLKVTKYSGLSPSEVQISALGGVRFQTTTNGKNESLIIVRPQGWQRTKIYVKAGQHLSFEASGRVCIDMYGLIDAAERMHALEQDEAKKHPDVIDPSHPETADAQKAPENFFDEDENKDEARKLREQFAYLWAGPEGFHADKNYRVDKDFPGRTKNKAIPSAPYGALIGYINPGNDFTSDDSVRKHFFQIGNGRDPALDLNPMLVPNDGELWLNVNDVIDPHDHKDSRIYYFDNVGFFWVKITVED